MPAPPGTIPINGEFAPSAGRNTNAIADSDDIRGCPKQVADIAARNAISQDDAKLGMLCTVQDDGMGAVATYILNAMPPSIGANWGLFSSGGGGGGVTMLTTPNNTVVLSASSGPVTIDVDQATTVTDVGSATGAVGTSAKSAREDHAHACTYGTAANTICQGNDSRLSDSRAPTGAAGGNLGGTYPNPSVTTDGTLSNSGSSIGVLQANTTPIAVGISSGAIGTSLRSAKQDHQHPVTYGTAANTVCQGNDSRLSDSRTPTGAAGGNLGGTYPNPSVTTDSTLSNSGSSIGVNQATATPVAVGGTTGAVGTAAKSAREDHQHAATYGTAANTICQGNDSRLSDSRTPTGAAGGELAGTYPNPTVPGLAPDFTYGPTVISSATTTTLFTIPIASDTTYLVEYAVEVRDTGSNCAEWIDCITVQRAGSGPVQLGGSKGPAPTSNISTSTLSGVWITSVASGNNWIVSIVTSNSSSINVTGKCWTTSFSLAHA